MQLFTIEMISQEGSTATFKATLEPSHRIFEGHFPDTPVVPGVCSMAMIKSCCAMVLGREPRYDTIKEVKFLAMILPSECRELMVKIEFREAMSISAVVSNVEATPMIKLRATLI